MGLRAWACVGAWTARTSLCQPGVSANPKWQGVGALCTLLGGE